MQEQLSRGAGPGTGEPPAGIQPIVEPVASENKEARKLGRHHLFLATVAVFVILFVLFAVTGRIDTLARNIAERFASAEPAVAEVEEIVGAAKEEVSTLFRFKDLDIHPDRLYTPYTAGPILEAGANTNGHQIRQFRELIELYQQRQGQDDNFTIRVIDNRTNKLLELFVLEDARNKYHETGRADWNAIDRLRRQETRRLVDKYAARGIPRKAVTVKWGRANQVKEARQSELSTIEYEVQLARYLDLSLLPTEIGTVETFNQDHLVSSVGARSRYQMMPYLLRQHGIRHYDLRTAAGNIVPVYEEWHPLITMEPSFLTLKSYINAVGHEIPGISAYHTGPGNIYMVYRSYLANKRNHLSPSSSVMDAYMWAVTDGFETVSKGTSFGTYSRGYVASAYGSLKAMEEEPIDTSHTVLAERVQLKTGRQIFLSQLLRTLGKHRDMLLIRGDQDRHLYDVFRELNPHIQLPEASDDQAVPVRGDISLSSKSGAADVRFFLPLGASRALAQAGLNILDEKKTFVFNHDTYRDPNLGLKTMWDREYEELVREIGKFGFTLANRARLSRLVSRFEQLAESDPSHYRKMQLYIIKQHAGIWQTGPWNNMAAAVSEVAPRLMPQPMSPLPAASGSDLLGLAR